MTPVATTFFFYFLSAMAIVCAVLVITRRNPVHSALLLIMTLLALAGLYLMLYAPFVAGVQILVYAGGIMVLFLFVIMLVNIERAQLEERFNKHVAGGIAGDGRPGRVVPVHLHQGQRGFPDQRPPVPRSQEHAAGRAYALPGLPAAL